jgi:hypothetical protein
MAATDSSSNRTDNIFEFIEHGFVELRSNSFAAYVELETTIQPSLELISYQANLPSISFSAFQVCSTLYDFMADFRFLDPGHCQCGPSADPSSQHGTSTLYRA